MTSDDLTYKATAGLCPKCSESVLDTLEEMCSSDIDDPNESLEDYLARVGLEGLDESEDVLDNFDIMTLENYLQEEESIETGQEERRNRRRV